MMLPDSGPFEMETTFLVSSEGVVTVSVDLFLSRTMGMHQPRPVFRARTRRAMRPLDKGPGGPVEIGFDRGEWALGALGKTIKEVEVTSETVDVGALFGVVRRLTADAFLGHILDGTSGREHRKAGHVGWSAHEAQVAEIPGDLAADEGFARVARSCLTQMSANAQLLRSSSNREALHQLRVGIRRLRAGFATFGSILPRDTLNRWKSETKWFAGELDTARNLDVFIEYVAGSVKSDAHGDPMLAEFGERLIFARAMAYDVALAAVDSKRVSLFLLEINEWNKLAPRRITDDAAMAILRDGDASILAAQALKHLHRQLRNTGQHLAALDPAGRHEVRIKAKKLRYATEFFSETFGKTARKRHSKFVSTLTKLQNALGELNDIATARHCALSVAGHNAGLAFRAGQIVGSRSRDEPRLLAKAVRAYAQWSDTKGFWA
jgi:CHAD domain-containing protein